ncbi:MAG: redox-regulated ATPase YchF [Candidatus Omnitrophica bacterium]|nr:redox-regulated ATPase YchF [Candidatus Omnitrophota bacterium]MBU1925994.1 redox-regulated ATPase YchF [Candidatus Omnitrophota bacterium]
MKIGIIGLPQTGKKTLFEILANRKPTENEIASKKPIKGIVEVRDPRFDMLAKTYKPKKEVRARIEIEILPKLEKDTLVEGDVFTDINELDAICHVVRAFKEESIYHAEGSVDPKRDIDLVNAELILHDLVFIEKRMENIEKKEKWLKKESVEKEQLLLVKLKAYLEKELPLRLMALTADEIKMISSYPFITRKTLIIALNISEEDLKNTALIEQLKRDYQAAAIDIMQISARVESEIIKLESDEERQQFLKELGIKEPATDALSRLCIKALNLISFFTVGQDEVRQWTTRFGSTAPVAAGVIHTDLQKGFIRAEVIKYSDFAIYGSEAKVKEAGNLYVKGKDYIVEDGDMLDIRFSV